MQEDVNMNRGDCAFRRMLCRFPTSRHDDNTCANCLAGQQIDILHLMYDAFMEKKMDNMEDDMHEPN